MASRRRKKRKKSFRVDVAHLAELRGLEARREDGSRYGEVVAAYNFGAGDVIEIQFPNGKMEMIPFREPYVGRVSKEQKTVIVYPPEYVEAKPEAE